MFRSRPRISRLSALGLLAALAACAPLGGDGASSDTPPLDAADRYEDPSGVLESASRRLGDNVSAGDVGAEFHIPDGEVPYPDTHWSVADNGIDHRWVAADVPSPLEKYMLLADPRGMEDARDWNRRHFGSGLGQVARSWGIAHGWVGAALNERPIKHGVLARIDGEVVRACAAMAPGCVRFEIGDINALEASVYVDGATAYVGTRCHGAASELRRDASGRIDSASLGPDCAGIDAGALMIALRHRVRRDNLALAIDTADASGADGVSSHPIFGYSVTRFEPLGADEAARLVTGAHAGAALLPDAHGFVRVDLTLHAVAAVGPNRASVPGKDASCDVRVSAILELDRAASSDARILGGEYIAGDPHTGGDGPRILERPFVWVSRGPGPETAPRWAHGRHNPFLSTLVIAQLVELGRS